MDNYFISLYKQMREDGQYNQEKKSFNSIIDNLFKKNNRHADKLQELDEFDGESLYGNTTLYPGNIYAFQYTATKPGRYTDGFTTFEWYDALPIVLITRVTDKTVSGINLNMCNTAVRVQVLNALYNLDIDYYKSGAEEMAINGRKPISQSVMKTFMSPTSEKSFYDYIKYICKLKNTEFIYRTYSITKIKSPRLIETWQYKYIPFLNYTGELKGDILKKIQTISGMSNEDS